MKTFNEFYARWKEVQRTYDELGREAASDMLEQLEAEVQETGKGNLCTFYELAETMDCGNKFPVIRNTFCKVEDYNKFFNDFEINEFAYCEESTATLRTIAEFMELGWRVDMHAVEVSIYKWEDKKRKAIKFVR